jgi:hypothetical protein
LPAILASGMLTTMTWELLHGVGSLLCYFGPPVSSWARAKPVFRLDLVRK